MKVKIKTNYHRLQDSFSPLRFHITVRCFKEHVNLFLCLIKFLPPSCVLLQDISFYILYKGTLYSELTYTDVIITFGELEAYISAFTLLAIYGKQQSVSFFCRLTPREKNPSTHRTGNAAGTRDGLDSAERRKTFCRPYTL
jgi:hypothetical protein